MSFETILNKEKKRVTRRINEILEVDDFVFNVEYLMDIHKYLFSGVLLGAGNFRNCNLTRKEIILNGDSVKYADYMRILLYLEYDFENEKTIDYRHLSMEQLIKRIASYTSRMWLVHPFRDGNTRTVSVFIQKYLQYLGYDINNDIFRENSKYFRNALVLSGYCNSTLNINFDYRPLVKFFEKILIDQNIILSDDDLIIKELFTTENNSYRKVLKK